MSSPVRPTHRLSGWWFVTAWLLARGITIWAWREKYRWTGNDVNYYFAKLEGLARDGLGSTLIEYPTPVVFGLQVLHAMTRHDGGVFLMAFVVAMAGLDAAFTWLVWRSRTRMAPLATGFWIVFVSCVGPLVWFRFDLLPAVLAGAALLLLRRHPALTGGLIGLGAAVKLWPAMLIGPPLARLAAPRAERVRSGAGFVVVGVGLALVSLVAGGWARLVSPLTWQSDRGLQIESVWATPLMVRRAVQQEGLWKVALSRYNAFEIAGPGSVAWQQVSTVVTMVGLALIVVLMGRLAWTRTSSLPAVALTSLAIVLVMIVTNKTLSPQYIIWVGGPLAAYLVSLDTLPADAPRWIRRQGLPLALVGVLLAITTQLVFPVFYMGLVSQPHGTVEAAVWLAVRNALLLAMTVWVAVASWLAAGQKTDATESGTHASAG